MNAKKPESLFLLILPKDCSVSKIRVVYGLNDIVNNFKSRPFMFEILPAIKPWICIRKVTRQFEGTRMKKTNQKEK